MTGPHWFLVGCFAVFSVYTRILINRAFPREGAGGLAESRGDAPAAVLYSLTGAMMPWRKETASRHIISYALGIDLHIGVLLGFVWVVLLFFGVRLPAVLETASIAMLLLGALSGLMLLVKRAATPAMRYLSNPDDYFSNAAVTAFLIIAAAALLSDSMKPVLLLYAGLLFLYIPAGKLRHAIYFGLARIYLGLFYGRRGVWPSGRRKSWRMRS